MRQAIEAIDKLWNKINISSLPNPLATVANIKKISAKTPKTRETFVIAAHFVFFSSSFLSFSFNLLLFSKKIASS